VAGTDHWSTVERIYHEAVERPLADRPAFLESACAGDDALHREVESLLANDRDSFLEKSARDLAAQQMVRDMTLSWVGRRIRGYEILGLVGAGGMGEVYRARDTTLGREVALKVLPREVSGDPDQLRRLDREARVLASLNHRNIATLHGLEESDGQRFLVMELVAGQTLAERLRHGALRVGEALEVCRQIAEGLEAAHHTGIVHRDLKPANIKVTPDGEVKLLDFGLARTLGTPSRPVDSSMTATEATGANALIGTPAYMSPEQARGQSADQRADIWAFGCVLYETLTGRRAFGGNTVADTLAAVLEKDPDWSALSDSVPPAARQLLRRCLAKNVRQRLQHVGDARLELEELASGPDARATTARPLRRQMPGVSWIIAGVAVLSVAVLGTYLVSRPRTVPTHAMHFRAVTNFSGVESQPSFSPDARSVAFVSDRDGQSDIYVGLVAEGTLVRITNDPNVELQPKWSPDGTALLFERLNELGGSDLWKVPALGGVARRIVLNGQSPTWSADGRLIAYSSQGVIWISDAAGATPRQVTQPEPPLFHYQPAFAHNGRSLAFIRKHNGPYGELALLDMASGSIRALTHDGALALSPVWSPDDKTIFVTSSRGGTLNVWRIPVIGSEPVPITAGNGDDTDIDLSSDGSRLVFSTYKANLNLGEVSLEPRSAGRLTWLTSDSVRGEVFPRYSPDGRQIAYFTNRVGGERESVWVAEADGATAVRIADGEHPRWTGDGQELLIATGRASDSLPRVLSRISLTGGVPHQLPIQLWTQPWGDVAANGRVAYRTSARTVEIYDPRTNQRHTIENVPGIPFWSPDGQRFAFIVRPGTAKPSDSGLWTETPSGDRHQAFAGWVLWCDWSTNQDLWVLEGKPDLKGRLWRVSHTGSRTLVLPAVPLYILHYSRHIGPQARFDIHPDHHRIAIDALESLQADIGMIDNVQ